jgi:5-bromo-4-chloroindolyl phosphate hydrolysis protein
MTQEALKLALEALETELSIDWTNNDEFSASAEKMYEAIAAIKGALAKEKALQALHSENERLGLYKDAYAQPEQEPSGHFLDFAYSDSIAYVHVYDQFRKGQQFYKAPPQRTWAGLTDEEISELIRETHNTGSFVRAIEAKLKQKNGYAEEKNNA